MVGGGDIRRKRRRRRKRRVCIRSGLCLFIVFVSDRYKSEGIGSNCGSVLLD